MAAKPAPRTEVATTNAFAMERPAYINADSSRGSEEVGSKDIALPRLEIVQSQSPIKEEKGVPEGHFFNSATQEPLGDLVYFVPCYFRTEYLVWKDQNEGGGFFGAFNTMAEGEARKREVVEDGEDPDVIEVVDTPVHYGLLVDPDTGNPPQQIVVSMPKSKAKVSRKWNSMIQIAGGDRFSRVYKLTTFTDENKRGQKFKNFVVQPAGFVPEHIYRLAEKNYEILKQGGMRAAHETVVDNDGGEGGRGDI